MTVAEKLASGYHYVCYTFTLHSKSIPQSTMHTPEAIRNRLLLLATLVAFGSVFTGLYISAGEYTGKADPEDAIAKNGPIFEDWPTPTLALVFSGEMNGFLEPCGCAGLDNQLGGLKRRHTLLKQLEEQGWPLVKLDMGGLVRRVGLQSEVKYRFAIESLIKLGYHGVGIGATELLLSSNSMLFVLVNLTEENPLVSANVSLFGEDSGFTKPYKVIEAGGKRIGITSVLGETHKNATENNSDVTWQDPTESLSKVVPQMEAENCELLVLMVHGDPNESTALAKKFPAFDFVSTTDGAEVPPNRTIAIEGTPTQMVEAGHKGMYVTVVGIFDDPNEPLRYQRVPLDHRFEDSEEMQQMLVDYQDELKTTGLKGLGVLGGKNPDGQFVGSETCSECHTEAAAVYEKTPHAHATETLVKIDPPRHFDPECLSCHVTGWNPQRYSSYASGYMDLKSTPHLTANGCENCHGPGADHVAVESGEREVSEEEQERLRSLMRLTIVENEGNKDGQEFEKAVVVKMCIECHDEDNSPDFDFQEYWPKVAHEGKY